MDGIDGMDGIRVFSNFLKTLNTDDDQLKFSFQKDEIYARQ